MPFEATALSLVLKAVEFAAHKHKDQRRKDAAASPYINHPIALAHILANEGGITDPEVICGALLHDTLEDTETSPQELETAFGTAIKNIVLEVTDDKTLPKDKRKQLQIEHAAHISAKAKLVKLADKIANLRDIAAAPPHDWTLERKQAYFDWAKAVVDNLRGVHPQLEAAFDKVYADKPADDRAATAPKGIRPPRQNFG